jgi:hypothetical protein
MSSREEIKVGQVWESRDSRERGLRATVLDIDAGVNTYGNGFVTVQRFRKSRMRASTLRSRYSLIKPRGAS